MSNNQQTVRTPVTVTGVGLHTGENINLTIKPSAENTGIVFLRTDIGPDAFVAADAHNVVDTIRGTNLVSNGIRVSTVEHLLAALTGMGIDNAIIELDKPEAPILDGSSRFYVEALKQAGVTEQNTPRDFFEVTEPIRFYHEEKDCEILALPSDHYRITCLIDYQSPVLNHLHASLDHISDFATEIAPCRTFVFFHELEDLVGRQLIKGGDLNNAIVFVDKPVSDESLIRMSALFNKPDIQVVGKGILNNVELYFPNEAARHKLLDIVGDLTLIGKHLKGHIIAKKPGHASNVLFAKHIQSLIKEQAGQEQVPRYDPNEPPVYDINDIRKMLPHRPPFLLVDKIIDMGDSHIVGLKNVTMNESFFTGHFPNEPIMPGVLQIEAMAQTGGILFLSGIKDPENYSTYFLKIDNVRFKHKVIPGDTLIFSLRLISPIRRGICHMKGQAFVGNKVVMEAEMMAYVAKNP